MSRSFPECRYFSDNESNIDDLDKRMNEIEAKFNETAS